MKTISSSFPKCMSKQMQKLGFYQRWGFRFMPTKVVRRDGEKHPRLNLLRYTRITSFLVILLSIACNCAFAEGNADQPTHKKKINPLLEDVVVPPEAAQPLMTTNVDDHLKPPLQFRFDSIAPPLFEKNYKTKKQSPFREKKTINFNKKIAKDKKEGFLLRSFAAEKRGLSQIFDPNLEKKKERKHDFLSQKPSLSLEQPSLDRSSSFSFQHPKSEEASLIRHDFSHYKKSQEVDLFLKELKTAKPAPTVFPEEQAPIFSYFPSNERVEKRHFFEDGCYFSFDSSIPLTHLCPLKNYLAFDATLIKNNTPPEKVHFSRKNYCIENSFLSLQLENPAEAIEKTEGLPLIPSLEIMNACFCLNETQIALKTPKASTLFFSFEELFFTFDLPYLPYEHKKNELEFSSFSGESFKNSPYLCVESTETLEAPPHYYPSREKPLNPELGGNSLLSFPEAMNTLTSNLSIESPFFLMGMSDRQDFLAIISCSIEFPHIKTPPSPSELSFKKEGLLSSTLEEEKGSFATMPSLEKSPSQAFDPILNLEVSPEKSFVTFALTQYEPSSGLILKYPSFPKYPCRALSQLVIKGSYISNEILSEDFTDSNDYHPSSQQIKQSLPSKLPDFSLPKSPSSYFILGTESNLPIEIHDSEMYYEKIRNKENQNLNSEKMPLPYVTKKEINPKKEASAPKGLVEDIPSIESLLSLFEYGGFSTKGEDGLLAPFNERFSGQDNSNPLRPPSYPLEASGLDAITIAIPTVQEMQLEYVKNKTAPILCFSEGLASPEAAGEKVTLSKALMTPNLSFRDFSEANCLIRLANREESAPSVSELLDKSSGPEKIQPDISFFTKDLSPVKTDLILSQSQEILEDYHEETLVLPGHVALANPDLEGSPSDSEKRTLNQSNRFTEAFLTEIPPPSHLETISYNNEFETSVHYSKKEDGKGYLFSIKMKPSQNLNFASPSQHYIFVVDGSSSIKKHRFGVFKEGVGQALSYLGEGDSFNIVIADAEVAHFSEKPTPWSKASATKAKRFLMEQDYRGFFINYNAFDLLSKVSKYFSSDKENIVVLITDGHSFKSLQDHKDDFKKLAQESKEKFSLFTATASQGNNLSMLDLLSTFNNGELMYSKTNASFSRQLAILVRHIESFVAKNIHVNVTSTSQDTGIEFYPNEKTLPSLYADRPYIIYGSINDLKDFDLILQGKSGDKWINIKQTISFKYAEKATHTIKKGIALQKAYVCYDYFLKNDDPFFLKEAQNILEPHHIPAAVR